MQNSRPTPKQWSAINNGRPIDFKPYAFANTTIRLTKRDNAATINPAQIYNLNLECLYLLFNLTVHTRTPVLPYKAVICNPDILGMVITSRAEPLNDIAIAVVDEAFESLQELTHHLSIQEMDFEIYNTNETGSEPQQLVAKGCLAFQDCGQTAGTVPSNITLTELSSPRFGAEVPTDDPNVEKTIIFVPQPHSSPLSLSAFADVTTVFYRALLTRILSLPLSANLTMPAEPPQLPTPPLHATQLWETNLYNTLLIVFAQFWTSQYSFTLVDIAEIIQFQFRKRLVDGGLRNGVRGYFEKRVKGHVPVYLTRTGEFCLFFAFLEEEANLCERLFSLHPDDHPGGVTTNVATA
ncbi:MAG: hypothetical protein LQ350_008066 [Teloschistes chrysophthalmus]|nr:MAG: hypothetical protein LQ350_008066 [Niorma chrysophthalma]